MTKNIALFIDGTWNDDRAGPYTNVRKLFARAEVASPAKQVVHYMRGIGTAPRSNADVPDWLLRADIRLKNKKFYVRLFDKALMARNPLSRFLYAWVFGGMFGYGMSRRILEAYAFLVEHYDPTSQDQIYIFGFSRGAYAARSLVCFIDKVGLLLKDHLDNVEEAYAIYENSGRDGLGGLEAFLREVTGNGGVHRGDFPTVLPVYLLGVWDTVRELGGPSWLQKFSLFDTTFHQHAVPSNVSHVRHALALHELRERFEPVLWSTCESGQSLKQVWFAGAHADIGGGYPDTTLSDISLEWMASEAKSLSLDVAACPSVAQRRDYSRSVHNVISGCFILFTPKVRRYLRDMLEFIANDDIHHHYLHESVGQRLSNKSAIEYEFFDYATNAALQEVDRATKCLGFCSWLLRPFDLPDRALVGEPLE
jgi:uncharacterized protein (DUF2235 family)